MGTEPAVPVPPTMQLARRHFAPSHPGEPRSGRTILPLIAGLGLLVLACTGWIVWREASRAEPGAAQAALASDRSVAHDVGPAPVVMGTSPQVPERREAEVPPRERGTASAPAVTLELVLADSGLPLAGASVQAVGHGPLPTTKLTASETGRVALHVEAPAFLRALRILDFGNDFPAWMELGMELQPGEGLERRIELQGGPHLMVAVLNEAERPIPFAEVHAWVGPDARGEPDRTFRTSAEGYFTLPLRFGPIVVSAGAPGYVPLDSVRAQRRAAGEIVLHLAAPSKLRVRVLSEEREPIAGATVKILERRHAHGPMPAGAQAFQLEDGIAQTGSHGMVELSDVPNAPCGILVHAAGFEPWQGWTSPGVDLEVVLRQAGAIAGLVYRSDGAPVTGAEITLRTKQVLARTTSDQDGYFNLQLGGRQAGAWIGVVAEGYAIQVVEPVPPVWDFLGIALEPAEALAGRLLLADGPPASGIVVHIEGDRTVTGETPARLHEVPTWEHFLAQDEVRTDEGGRFRFEHLYAGVFEISAPLPDEPERRQRWLARSGTEDVELRFDAAAVDDVILEVSVQDAVSGLPLQQVQVIVLGYHPDGSPYNSERKLLDSKRGVFRIAGLRPGKVGLVVEAPGFAMASVPVEERSAGVHWVAVELAPTRTIRLRLLDLAGAPLVSARVGLAWRGKSFWLVTPEGGRTALLNTGEDGEVVLRDIPGDLLEAEIYMPGVTEAIKLPLDARSQPPDGMVELRIDFERPPR
jgi:hypothetical protein